MWKLLFMTLTCSLLCSNTQAQDNAVILVYHHVSEDTPKSTSVSPTTFEQHMQHLANNHQVLPLKAVIEKLQAGQPLPDKAVVITFDDGYNNIYENAHPIMQKFGFPYTVFVNPALIGVQHSQLTWQQVKQMSKEHVSFANHGNQHIHSLQLQANESQKAWLKRVVSNVEDAETLLAEKVGDSLKYFAYPYGEFDQPFKQKLTQLGYVSFAQHSGAIASHSDFSALPRYPAAGIYSSLNSLKVKLNSLAMSVTDIQPTEPKLAATNKNISVEFTVDSHDLHPAEINCFKNNKKLEHNNQNGKISMTLNHTLPAGRHRINCTAPSLKDRSRYYWLSLPFFVPTENGEWLE